MIGCGILPKNKAITGISVEVQPDAPVNYNLKIPVKVFAVLADGNKKNITSNKSLKCNATNSVFLNKGLYPISRPDNYDYNNLTATFTFENNDQTFSETIQLDFNYKGVLKMDFNGTNGTEGKRGSRGSLNVLTRDGADGNKGDDGTNGTDGHNLLVNIWKENEVFFWLVQDLTADSIFCYKSTLETDKIIINANGGNGGEGGNGGNGRNGKDGTNKDGKIKRPGDGGDGGDGGNSGNGGNGGSVHVFIHPNAPGVKSKIVINNTGGSSAEPGTGGSAGDKGVPLEGQAEPQPGVVGRQGTLGTEGVKGPVNISEHEFFDIEYVKSLVNQ